MRKVPKLRSITDVVHGDLCVSCGGCVIAAGNSQIAWDYDARRAQYIPRAQLRGSSPELEDAFDVCPGKGVELLRLSETVRSQNARYDIELGYVLDVWAARSTDARVLKKASSGGIITSVAQYLLSTGSVTGVLATRFAYGLDGPRPEAVIARDLPSLFDCQGSKYCPVSPYATLESLKCGNDRIAFIGTPCQIASLRMLMERNEWLRRQIVFVIGSFCGGMKTFKEMDALIRRQRIEPGDVVHFAYRGGGQPGNMTIEEKQGGKRERPYPDYVTDTGFKKLNRCRLCIDGTAELADLSCGDAWIPRFMKSGNAWSIAITRNEKCTNIIQGMRDRGLIEIREVDLNEIKYSQRSNLSSKKTRQTARRRLHRFLGRPVPFYDGGFPQTATSLAFEAKVHLRHSILKWLETLRLYWPFIKFARWVRGSNEFRRGVTK